MPAPDLAHVVGVKKVGGVILNVSGRILDGRDEPSDVEEMYFPEEYISPWSFDEEIDEEIAGLSETFRGVLHEDYARAADEEVEDALFNVLESLAPAEAFNLTKALSQIEKGAAHALRDPALGQVAKAALPVAGGAVGAYLGGPAGTAVGTGLGNAAAKALPATKKAGSPANGKAARLEPAAGATPAVAGGSAAAAQGLVLTQQPEVLKSLLALALGGHGRKAVDGVPVGAVMSMLSNVFAQAAADADELLYEDDEATYLIDGEGGPRVDPAVPEDRAQALYVTFLEAENQYLTEAVDER
ncbi:hypothetical protein ABZ801_35520 [Actinomadura sp. NPDC047616]|uniref:hypothetical protein n=1 Tax=Actinomadura sp. NPDC047616 TaxID=3155914 RepID=UPI0033C19F5D